jgi:signal transduction histidine kinase
MPVIATGHTRTKHLHTLLVLWIAAAALVFVNWWQVFGMVRENRAREIAVAERDLANLTRVSQEHANRTLRSADQVIRFVQSSYLEIGERLDLQALTAKGVIDDEIFNQVGVIDAQGIYVLSNRPMTARLDLSDREHFKVHVAAETGELFVSKPIIGRATGKWSIQLSRRITRANGEFAGVVVISIDPSYFSRFYGELNLGQHGLSGLYGLDGFARVRKVGTKEEFGTNAVEAKMFKDIANGNLFGSYVQHSVIDGIERLYYYRKIPNYKLVVSSGIDIQDLLDNHLRARNALWLQAALLSLLILALAAALTRQLQQIRHELVARQIALMQFQTLTEQLDTIFTLSPDGIVSFDQQHRVKHINPAFVRMMAHGADLLPGQHEEEFSAWLTELCKPGSTYTGIASQRSQISRDNPEGRQFIEIENHGKLVLQIGLRCSESEALSQILYFRDVTRETEIDQMKSEFLSTAAHELRTPMASIFGFAELLLSPEVDPSSQPEFAATIYRQSKLMATILDDLLDLARIEARRDKDFRYTRVLLQELVTDLIKGFVRTPGRSAPELSMPVQPLFVMADADKLRQAILNVLSNAYKYSPEGGTVFLKIERMHDARQPPQVVIEVTDKGIGMTAEQTRRVYERFYRADASGKIAGTGLGMSITKEIVELHRGTINIRSIFGQGTCVSLCLPLPNHSD